MDHGPGADGDIASGFPSNEEDRAHYIVALNEKMNWYTEQNDMAHRAIIDCQNEMGGKIDLLAGQIVEQSKALGAINGRIDAFMLSQAQNGNTLVDTLCRRMDEKWKTELAQIKSDGTRTDKRVNSMSNILFGSDKDGGLIAKNQSLEKVLNTSNKALWTVNGILFTFDLALVGYIIMRMAG